MNICYCFLLISGIIFTTGIRAQDDLSQQDSLPVSVSVEYVSKVSGKADGLNKKLDKQTTKALQQWKKQEDRIKRKLAKKTDSLKVATIFGNTEQQYKQLEQKLQSKTSLQRYIPSLDTLNSTLKFLQQNPQLLSRGKEAKEKLNGALLKVKGLETQFQKAEDVKSFLQQRKQYLKEQLSQLGFAKELKKLSRQSYYYRAQVDEYASLLKNHKKAERKVLELLSTSRLFKNFMRKKSMLADLFRLPGDDLSPTGGAGGGSLAGLQTRASVNGIIQQQIAAGGPNSLQQFQHNIQAAQSKLNELKTKITQAGNGSSDEEMPEGFKPNNQKTRSFLKRLELGTNIQSQRANGIFPVTSDLGVSLGYKLNDRSIVGVGSSYKLGLGQSIRHINITHQGLSIRSFVDYKIKGSFWLSGAYEMNYRSEFKRIEELKNLSGYQQSGLVGLSKVVSLKTKIFKKTTLRLMWDFLSYQQLPQTQPIIFRVSYQLK